MSSIILLFGNFVSNIFYRILLCVYVFWYPTNTDLRANIDNKFNKKFKKKQYSRINKLRFNNIIVVMWSHAGGVSAFILTIFSVLIAVGMILISLLGTSTEGGSFSINSLAHLALFVVSFLITFLVLPILLRKIIDHLPSDSYANISLGDFSQSEVLMFVSLKYWELCDNFIQKINLEEKIKRYKGTVKDDINEKIKIINETKTAAIKFKAEMYGAINNCKALKNEATFILNILPIEFSHHLTKFSPYIFEARIDTFILSLESMENLVQSSDFLKDKNSSQFYQYYMEVCSIFRDLRDKRKLYLFQLIAYENIHSYIIGLASITSTSGSFKIFCGGLSNLLEISDYGINDEWRYEPFKALLHRSKAHYGFDLLISLENFYSIYYKNEDKNKIPYILMEIKKNKKLLKIKEKDKILLLGINEDLIQKSNNALNCIKYEFKEKLTNYINSLPPFKSLCIFVFGYSRVVRDVLRDNSRIIRKNNITVFIMKEDCNIMLDTRIFRFELADKDGNKIRKSFTASDDFFINQFEEGGNLLMLAGAEIYDNKNKILYHTNNYQKRVSRIIKKLKKNIGAGRISMWVLAELYKIHEEGILSENSKSFIQEFFVDHYDKVDVYNLNRLGIEFDLIHDILKETNNEVT